MARTLPAGPLHPPSLRRCLVTPEGVELELDLGAAGTRAAAFMLDALMILFVLVALTLAVMFAGIASGAELLSIIWLIGFFLLRNGWFSFFEMGGRGATPGKRIMGLRVVARDGARLTGAAVMARNAMREIEVFLPLSFLAQQRAAGTADTFLTLFALGWSGIFLFFPLMNRDRLRIGDIVGGTWVVSSRRSKLGADLAADAERQRRSFSDAALDLYGVYELQTLEDVLRSGTDDTIHLVAQTIRAKAGIANDWQDREFLADYYAALCARLESGLLVGRRREHKGS
jgi:uncharacterized RDD family membrane protein YckC